jgi:hypothetical protein
MIQTWKVAKVSGEETSHGTGLLAIDSCTLCGQAVVYSDIDEVRTQDYGG